MGLDGELKYIFIQLKIIFISTQHSFIKKIFQFSEGVYTHSCHAKQENTDASIGQLKKCV